MSKEKKLLMQDDMIQENDLRITQIFEMYKTDVFRFALCMTRDTYLAQDVTQQVFLNLTQNIHLIMDISKIKTWLLTTTKNVTINMLRKQSFEKKQYDMPLPPAPTENSQLEFFEMLDCLDKIDRQIVVLHIVSGLKHAEIASIIGLKPGTVRQRYLRSLNLIKKTFMEVFK
jgi:RNA polymerase sigma factor, sigma-70 family